MSAMDFCIRSDLGATNRRHPVPGILRFCNYLQNVGATTCILGLQLSTFIFYNKQPGFAKTSLSGSLRITTPRNP